MKVRLTALALVVALLGSFSLAPVRAHAAAPAATASGSLTVPITLNGVLPGGGAGSFTGTLNVTSFVVQNGQVVALGTLTGTVRNAAGTALGTLTNFPVTLPIVGGAAEAACQILHLDIGPINLNLLGLVIQTNRIVIDITAVPGAGNLLGNLLCGVAHLLDNPGNPANAIANLLNRILGLLG